MTEPTPATPGDPTIAGTQADSEPDDVEAGGPAADTELVPDDAATTVTEPTVTEPTVTETDTEPVPDDTAPADTEPAVTAPGDTAPAEPAPGDRLVISSDDLAAASVDERVRQMRAATAPQMVKAVGEVPSGFRSRSVALVMLLAGLVGGLLGWGASELISQSWRLEQSLTVENLTECNPTTQAEFEDCIYEPWYGFGPVASSVAFITPFAIVLGVVLIGWEGIQTRSGAKLWRTAGRALPLLAGAGALGAWLAAEVYASMIEDVTSVDDLHLPRGVAWAIMGCAIGVAIGGASRSGQRVLNGAIGGAVGGFVGGFVFDYISLSDTNGVPNRVVGLALTGAFVGLAIGLVEHARREHWLEIVSGGMAGKQFILYRDVTTIGSSPSCDITLIKDPGIGAQHATLQTGGGAAELRTFSPELTVRVNGTPTTQHRLGEGDLVEMGATIVRYRSKAEATPTLAAPLPPRPPS